MTKFLLSVHVLAAIITIGPVTVAASMFPPAARRAWAAAGAAAGAGSTGTAGPTAIAGAGHELTALRTLHRICQVYAAVGLVVPTFGLATASSLGILGETWLIVSIVLTAAAAAVLVLLVLPRQAKILAELTPPAAGLATAATTTSARPRQVSARLAMHTGIFNLLWAVVTVLMILRPGSTTNV
ncbi:MAG TPA: hypothetical protein VH141_02195 [Pseudonocardia sp.]|nr:hypothetical protein [Pseudonocardia sp.]